ncbi:hypothetical protein LUZ60_005977 [Juncus effusus]|nr:hypothetical protein LUZ60_005977 [Juncus effusus]
MCPLAPSGLLLDINTFSSDEDYVKYLIERRTGDLLPKNVSTDINPFLIEPQDSSESTWYLCLKGVNGESSMRKPENGFWKEINKIEISFNGNIGWKNTLEFYEGAVRTGYMMLEYHIKPNLEGASDTQDYSSLCRIFWQNERSSSLIEQQNLLALLSDRNELSPAPSLRESNPNNNNNNINNTNISNNENSYIELYDFLSSETQTNSKNSQNNNNNNDNNNNSDCDFSIGDYLELQDILSYDSGSTSSGNSSRMEYFDPDELLREIAGDRNPDLLQGTERGEIEREGSVGSGVSVTGPLQSDQRLNFTGTVLSEQRFSVTGPVQSDQSISITGPVQYQGRLSVAGPVQTEQVLIRPEPDLVPVPNLHDFIMNENMQNEGPSTSRTSRVKRNLSDGTSSNSSSNNSNNNDSNNSRSPTQRERNRSSVIRLAKLGRKLFCFAGF